VSHPKSTVKLISVIFHDCDLLPPASLLNWYLKPPPRGKPIHLFAPGLCQSPKYIDDHLDFFGGVVALHPSDFEICNGFPNDLWGWGHEDDQLLLRLKAVGVLDTVMRPPKNLGFFTDMDPMDNTRILRNDHSYSMSYLVNEYASHASLDLDPNWSKGNGLKGLKYRILNQHINTNANYTVVNILAELTQTRWPRPRTSRSNPAAP